MYKRLLRPVLFSIDPERVHHLVFRFLKVFCSIPGMPAMLRSMFRIKSEKLAVTKMGLRFPNPVGLAAGFDKDAKLYDELACFGFGFIEIGTVTPKPQSGNPKPRMFRLPSGKGLINRMGFNNEGADAAAKRLNRKRQLIVGGNIGKNKATPNEQAVDDYIYCFNALFDVVDYFVVNVSSPNTAGLRELQDKEPLMHLLQTLQTLNNEKNNPKPILLKIAPDLANSQLDEIVEIVTAVNLSGIIATNTTIDKTSVKNEVHGNEEGGLSGLLLKKRATEVIRYLRQKAGKEMTIIGAGGIFTADDAKEKLAAGADLVQVYTGFIYEGPAIVKNICRGLAYGS